MPSLSGSSVGQPSLGSGGNPSSFSAGHLSSLSGMPSPSPSRSLTGGGGGGGSTTLASSWTFPEQPTRDVATGNDAATRAASKQVRKGAFMGAATSIRE